jgi:hypothetical protein
MISKPRISIVLACLISACEGAGGAGRGVESDVMATGPDLVAGPVVAMGPAAVNGDIGLYRAIDMALIGDSIAIADNGNERVVLLDGDMIMLWGTGREGAGPGEFDGLLAVRPSPGGLLAVDIGNGRFTELDRSGAVVRTIQAPYSADSFGVRADGGIVLPARLESHYALMLTDSGPTPIAARDSMAGADLFGNRARPPAIAVTQGDTIHVFDENAMRLFKYDPTGTRVMQRALPRAFTDSARNDSERRIDALERTGYRVVGITKTKGLTVTPDGRLLLQLTTGMTVGWIIDPHSYAAQRITIPRDIRDWTPLKNARGGMVAGNRMTVLHEDSIYTYDLREAGS